MAYIEPVSRANNFLVDATRWNQDVVANVSALHSGAMTVPSQAAGDFMVAASGTQLDRTDQASVVIMTQVFS